MNQRYLSLDIFRGITIAGMIMVNTSGNSNYTYSPLRHAHWHGFTPTDLVFPSFMFIVGVAMRFSLKPFNYQLTPDLRNKILKRTGLLFLISYIIFNFPWYNFDISHLRILNVLQRIALAFCIVSFVVLKVERKYLPYLAGGILLLYWALMWFLGDRGVEYDLLSNAERKLDLLVLGANHLYHGEGVAFDPEGILSTLPACVNTLLGYLTGIYLQEANENILPRIRKMAVWGIGLIILAMIWDTVFPINKKLWTSSFVLLTVGIDLVILSILVWIIDLKGKTKWTTFFHVFGMNSIFAYGVSEFLAILFNLIPMKEGDGTTSFYDWLYWHIFHPIFGNSNGALAFAVCFVLLCWGFSLILYRKKIFLKV
jgi:predicted acyltransferase